MEGSNFDWKVSCLLQKVAYFFHVLQSELVTGFFRTLLNKTESWHDNILSNKIRDILKVNQILKLKKKKEKTAWLTKITINWLTDKVWLTDQALQTDSVWLADWLTD